MKVALFTNRVGDPIRTMTGIGRYVKEVVTTLPTLAGDDEYLVSAPGGDPRPEWLPATVGYRPVTGPPKLIKAGWLVARRPRLERFVGQVDVVHALHPSFPLPTHRPAVLTVHDLLPIEHPEWSAWDERWGFSRALEQALDPGWVITVVSDFVGSQLRSWAGAERTRITTVRLGIGREFSAPVDPVEIDRLCQGYGLERGRYLLSVGRLIPRKNLAVIVEALHELGPDAPTVALVGSAEKATAPLLHQIERLGVEERVRILGFVDERQLIGLLQGARGLIHPSVAEGFGLPALEAMAAGTPVIASDGGSLPEIVADAGVLLDPTDSSAWAERMASLVADDALHDRLRSAGRGRAALFTWAETAAGVVRAHRLAASLN